MEVRMENDIFVSFEFSGEDASDTEACDKQVDEMTKCMSEAGYYMSNYAQVTHLTLGEQYYTVEQTWTKELD